MKACLKRRVWSAIEPRTIDLLAILKKNLDRTMFHYILQNFRMCIILIEALTPLGRTSCIKMYKSVARSRLFCRIAKRSIDLVHTFYTGQPKMRLCLDWHNEILVATYNSKIALSGLKR